LVLLGQCLYYRGFTWRDEVIPPASKPQHHAGEANETTGLLSSPLVRERRGSDWSNLSPAVPLIAEPAVVTTPAPPSTLQTITLNTVAVLMVCAAGVAGWLLSRGSPGDGGRNDGDDDVLTFNLWGQIFGYLCAVLYLGSRLPQILLNWRRKSTEGVSMLFFLFACLGNLTYVLSIIAYDPKCQHNECAPGEAAQIYGQYILVNTSWLVGSLGTLFLDLGIFVQFFIYNKAEEEDEEEVDEDQSIDSDRWDQRPLLQRGDSTGG
jgi:solute carrier family 66 (lysosomal lysine-arginine transporter), member 1